MAKSRKGGPRKIPGERYNSGDLKPRIDMGTPERAKQLGGLWLERFDQPHENGKSILQLKRMRARNASALEAMYNAGALGRGEQAVLRFTAGEWLVALYAKLHPGQSADLSGGGGGSRSQQFGWQTWSERKMADNVLLGRTLNALGIYAPAVVEVCCDDRVTRRTYQLCRGLDRLADVRGIEAGRKDHSQ